jgi:hypothetical protein
MKKKKITRKNQPNIKFTKAQLKEVFALPVEQSVIVPSTTAGDRRISPSTFKNRVREVRKYLSQKYGGYTSVRAVGGYYSADKRKVIKEPVTVVTSYATFDSHKENKNDLFRKLKQWSKKWGQESMGYSYEGDLYYINKNFPVRSVPNKRKDRIRFKMRKKK